MKVIKKIFLKKHQNVLEKKAIANAVEFVIN